MNATNAMQPTSAIDYYCVIGNPVAHSRSPSIHQQFATHTGQTLVYDKQLFTLADFQLQLEALRRLHDGTSTGYVLKGCNVTVPFKLEAANLATTCTERVRLSGACNVLVPIEGGWHADNTDGLGLVQDVTVNLQRPLQGLDLLVLGAGGASAGVLGPLLESRPARLVIANRTLAKAEHLIQQHAGLAKAYGVSLCAKRLDQLTEWVQEQGGFHVVVNATASSLGGEQLVLPDGLCLPNGLGYDMMYGDKAKPFLDWVVSQQAQPSDGLGMLVEQAAEAFQIWRGIRPPSSQVLRDMRVA
jgi:shikimate dehydrogenase